MQEQKPQKKKQPLTDQTRVYGKYATMAFQMAATIGLGVWGGTTLDKYFHTKFPGFTVGLSLLSVFGAMYWAIKDLLKKK